MERFYGAGAAKYDQIPGLARPCHHLDNFFEWKKTTTGKQPYRDRTGQSPADGHGRVVGNLALAGGRKNSQLHDHHDGAERAVCRVAYRMPVVLKPNAWPVWLGEEPADVPQLKAPVLPMK